ncbi:MAG: hypothetical protein KKB31_01720 [Nanoarchaeota archaeon]|nr:hypothetical protein [Nanoarchaeota archaeon]
MVTVLYVNIQGQVTPRNPAVDFFIDTRGRASSELERCFFNEVCSQDTGLCFTDNVACPYAQAYRIISALTDFIENDRARRR